MSAPNFAFGWQAGPSAEMEFFSDPGSEKSGTEKGSEKSGTEKASEKSGTEKYRLKYTLPFRATLRPPSKDLPLTTQSMYDFQARLQRIAMASDRREARPTSSPGAAGSISDEFETVGSQLMDLVVSGAEDLRIELETGNLLLEIGLDEALLGIPWELMYDGQQYLCLKHAVGRFVNTARPSPLPAHRPDPFNSDELSILLISVPRPNDRSGRSYKALPGVETETLVLVEILTKIDGVKVSTLVGPEATYDGVWRAATKQPRFHIVHFGGHAYFQDDQPENSSLVLFDKDMPTGSLQSFFGRKPPRLFVMNACETATTSGINTTWQGVYNIFGLARAFLDTGAYLIGTRWEVGDKSAAIFARELYSRFIAHTSIGEAIRAARIECKKAAATDDFSWASYIFYGDPRLRIERD